MKKIVLILAAIVISFTVTSEIANISNPIAGEHSHAITGKKITLINDTAKKLKVHTGSGSVSLNPRGGKNIIYLQSWKVS